MIGFWARDVASVIPRAPLTACSATPRPSRSCTWPLLLAPSGSADRPPIASASARLIDTATCHAVPEVSPAWEAIAALSDDDSEADAAGNSDSRSGGGASNAQSGGWQGALVVPELRNNGFFVRSMDEFVFEAEQP